MKHSPALPIAYIFLRILIVLNWLGGAGILAMLVLSFVNEPFLLRALRFGLPGENPSLLIGLRAIATLGLVTIPLNYALLKRLVAMVMTVRAGDPFVAANAYHLNAIAWFLLALQLLAVTMGAIGRAVSTAKHPFPIDAGFSMSGWLAVLLTFVLARVFAEGALMREDLEGTV